METREATFTKTSNDILHDRGRKCKCVCFPTSSIKQIARIMTDTWVIWNAWTSYNFIQLETSWKCSGIHHTKTVWVIAYRRLQTRESPAGLPRPSHAICEFLERLAEEHVRQCLRGVPPRGDVRAEQQRTVRGLPRGLALTSRSPAVLASHGGVLSCAQRTQQAQKAQEAGECPKSGEERDRHGGHCGWRTSGLRFKVLRCGESLPAFKASSKAAKPIKWKKYPEWRALHDFASKSLSPTAWDGAGELWVGSESGSSALQGQWHVIESDHGN